MAEDDDYEIISQREVKRLKNEINLLKGSGHIEGQRLQETIEDLTSKLNSMIDVFEAASEDMREEDKEAELISHKIDPIFEKLSELAEQNKKIADGLIAINSIVDEKLTQFTDMAESLNRQQNDLIEKLGDVMDNMKSSNSSSSSSNSLPPFPRQQPMFESRPQSSFESGPQAPDFPPLPTNTGMQRLEPSKRKGFHLF